MKNLYLSLLSIVLFSTVIFAQSAVYNSSIGAETSPIDDYIQNGIDEGIIPGGVFLVAEKGKINYLKSFGYDDELNNDAYKIDDIFRIASMTKSVTIVSILQLMEKGALRLDDPVSKFIPAFKNTQVLDRFSAADSSYTTVPQKKEITLRNLLTHTSGIYYGGFETDSLRAVYMKNDLMGFGLATDQYTTEEMVDKLAAAPLAFQPGSAYKYGLNMEVLGRVVEVVSNTSLDKYFKKNIFDPLGMKDTYFYLPKEKQARLVKIHASDTVKNIVDNPFLDYPKLPGPDHFAGGGGLSSTTTDYATLCMALANNGSLNKKRILKKKSAKLLSVLDFTELDASNKGFMSEVEEMGFGLGYWVVKKENPKMSPLSKGSFGWAGYFNTKYYIDPKKDVVIIGMTQIFAFGNEPFWQELNKVIYSTLD